MLGIGYGQETDFDYPSLSPLGTVSQSVGYTDIYIEYERPSVRGREIFGGLVPWNKVWRTGAGNATKIRFSKDVTVGGKPVKAGYYSILSIPEPEKWTVILNRDTTLYGSYKYNQNDDEVRFTADVETSKRYYESLTIDIDVIPNDARIYISWENVQISFLLETMADEEVMHHIMEELLSDEKYGADDYANAASFIKYDDGDLDVALQLAELAVQTDANAAYAHATKIEMLMLLGRFDEAREAADVAKGITRAKTTLDKKDKQSEIDYFDTLLMQTNDR